MWMTSYPSPTWHQRETHSTREGPEHLFSGPRSVTNVLVGTQLAASPGAASGSAEEKLEHGSPKAWPAMPVPWTPELACLSEAGPLSFPVLKLVPSTSVLSPGAEEPQWNVQTTESPSPHTGLDNVRSPPIIPWPWCMLPHNRCQSCP